MKILAVDDDLNALAILELALREAGYDNYDLVLSSAEALELIENADIQYDCLLLDIVMPGMNGVDLCRHVRKMPHYAHVPIIMITASKHKDILTSAIAAGATDYVNKPFEGLELVTRLRAAEALMKATRRYDHRDPRGSMPDHVVGLQLSDGFTLNANHCFFSQTELVCALGETDRYLCSIHLFAAALRDVERLFDTVPNLKFRNLINELATSIAFITEGWRPLISYAGDGVFVIALLDVGFLSAKDIHKVLKAGIEAQAFETLTSCSGELRLCVIPVQLSDPEKNLRIDSLFQAAAIAKASAGNCSSNENERKMRNQVLGTGKGRPEGQYEIRIARAATKKIVPRRLLSRGKEIAGDDGMG